ncbi:MAG TPA: hypothetical protein VLS93_19365 [Anaeromyxobacteraceae bacterium]|nr:hypothetical protein [Anaeromyxobacteraceae bacterium]
MPTWPDLTDYHEALQQPRRSFSDAALQEAAIELDRFGMPKPATGGNAVVYKATHRKDVWAVRCFLRPITDHAERYAAISAHLARAKTPFMTRFHYLRDGIRVKGNAFPLVKMEWVQGALLDRHVEGRLGKPRELAGLRDRWRALVRDLEAAKIAHGDLQHGNVLVRGDDLLLIDYDGMWVPSLAGRKATESGHRAYQHPARGEAHFGPWLDRFSALVVYLSLAALEKEPKLWEEYNTGDNLIFVREDFQDAGRSPVWGHLAGLGDEVKRLASVLAGAAAQDPKDAPRLDDVAEATGRFKTAALATPSPLPRKRLGWAAGPPRKGSPLDLAREWKVVWTRPGERLETRWKKVVRDAPVEVKKTVEVVAFPPWRTALAASAGVAAGAALGWFLSPALGLLAAGGGLSATRLLARRRKVQVRYQVMKPVEQQQKEEHKVVAPGLKSAVMALSASPDGKSAVAVSKLGECGTWEPASDGWRPFGGRLPPFEHAALARAIPRAALATDRAAVVWDLAQGKRTDHPCDPANRVHAIALSPDGARLALGTAQGVVRVLDAASGRALAEMPGPGPKVSAVAFSADGQLLAAGTASGATAFLRLAGGRLERTGEDRAQRPPVTAVAAAGAGQLFASADENGGVVVFGSDGRRRASAALGSRGVRVLAFCGDGPFALLAGCGDGSVKVLDPERGAVVASHAVGTAAVTALSFARERTALAVGTAAGQVAVLAIED